MNFLSQLLTNSANSMKYYPKNSYENESINALEEYSSIRERPLTISRD